LGPLIEDCSLIKAPLAYNKKYYEDVIEKTGLKLKFDKEDPNKFWLPLKGKSKGKIVSNGEVRV
jgi:hypothetical protein